MTLEWYQHAVFTGASDIGGPICKLRGGYCRADYTTREAHHRRMIREGWECVITPLPSAPDGTGRLSVSYRRPRGLIEAERRDEKRPKVKVDSGSWEGSSDVPE